MRDSPGRSDGPSAGEEDDYGPPTLRLSLNLLTGARPSDDPPVIDFTHRRSPRLLIARRVGWVGAGLLVAALVAFSGLNNHGGTHVIVKHAVPALVDPPVPHRRLKTRSLARRRKIVCCRARHSPRRPGWNSESRGVVAIRPLPVAPIYHSRSVSSVPVPTSSPRRRSRRLSSQSANVSQFSYLGR
jgi:hypothetical protein